METALLAYLLQTVWVVDAAGGPGANFTDLPPAVAAAADGDVLDVRPGLYNHFTLSGKGLRILGSDPATTFVSTPCFPCSGATSISNVPAGSVVTIARLTFGNTGLLSSPQAVTVSGVSTRAVLDDVTIHPDGAVAFPFSGSPIAPALTVSESEVHLFDSFLRGTTGCGCNGSGAPGIAASMGARVEVVSSTLQGGNGAPGQSGMSLGFVSEGGPGIEVTSTPGTLSRVWVADCLVQGGNGATTVIGTGSSGGAGISADSSFVRVSGGVGSQVVGGNGGALPGSGGPGISSSGTSSVAVHSPVVALGGSGVSGPAPATSGPGISLGLPPLPGLEASGNLSISGGAATITISDAPPSAPLVLAIDGVPAFAAISAPVLGEVVIGLTPALTLVPATSSPAGDFSLAVPLAGLPPSAAWLPFHLQGAALDAGGGVRLSTGEVAILRP